jgi:VanZ like family
VATDQSCVTVVELETEPDVTSNRVRILALISLAAIFALSLVRGEFRPHTPFLPSALEHVVAYGVAAFLLCLAYCHRIPSIWLVLLLTAYGALLELVQLSVPGRHGRLSDVMADLAGALIGAMLASAVTRLRNSAAPR